MKIDAIAVEVAHPVLASPRMQKDCHVSPVGERFVTAPLCVKTRLWASVRSAVNPGSDCFEVSIMGTGSAALY